MGKLNLPVMILTLVTILTATSGCSKSDIVENPRTISFDEGWRFIKGDPSGADNPGFDDSKWRIIDLPHDWSIEDLPEQKEDTIVGPFSRESVGKMGTGNTVGGTGWYRKSFTIDRADQDKTAYIQFDGVYMNSDVWINGFHVGNHPYGYTSFWYDITPLLNPAGQPNTVSVQVKNEGLNARWYSGSGIYRHTWLTLVNPVRIAPWGVFITTPEVSEKTAKVDIVTNVTNSSKNDSPVILKAELIDPSGALAGTSSLESLVPAGKSVEIKLSVMVENPELWSVENPNLYKAGVEVLVNNKTEDNLSTLFGIRTIKIDSQAGLTLNGKVESWPMFINFQGDLDIIGNPKVPYYYQHVVWREHKMAMFVHRPIPAGKKEITSPWGFPDELKSWSWEGHEGEKMQVHVYSRSKLVKLELNGKPVGEQAVDDSKSITATFEVPYEPGTLTARCFDNGEETASETIKTVGEPSAIRLTADRPTIRADRNDLSYTMAEIVDTEGNVIPYADNILVNFEISGNGEIAGVGSGSPTDMSSFQKPYKKSWQGRCLVIVRPKGDAGEIILTARAEGLKEAVAGITTKK